MSKKIPVLVILVFLLPFAAGAKAIGPSVSKYRGTELKWEEGAYGYHVMFKSLLENREPDADPNDPQADSCKTSSTYELGASHIPADAVIEDAYLAWTAAQPAAKKDSTTDSEVTLSFVSSDGLISETQTVKGKKAYKISEAGTVDFEFDAFRDSENTNKNWYTYRVKILDFFKSIQEKGRAGAVEGSAFNYGSSLLGSYTLSDLECTEDSVYKDSAEMVADWSIVLIYSSVKNGPKKIYMYDGFKAYRHELSEINVTGFEFPADPEVRITLASHEGDPGIVTLDNEPLVKEGIQVQGESTEWLFLYNDCNPQAWADEEQNVGYTEIFNSISSVYGYEGNDLKCIGGTPPALDYEEIEYGMDVDTFVINTASDSAFAPHFRKGGDKMSLRIGANQDSVITNYMIVSVDTKASRFDIPGRHEKVACTPANKFDDDALEGKWCRNGLEHTFALRVQNWGTDTTGAVTVVDAIPAGMEYVPGSTEYATSFKVEKGKKIAARWTPVPDAGGFPLEKGFKVADSLNFCPEGSDYLACDDLIVVRFRAKVKSDTPKNQIIENTATYKSAGLNDYRTNIGIPVKLRMASAGCVNSQDEVDLSDCGGADAAACGKNEDCPDGYVCDSVSGECIDDPSLVRCSNSLVTAAIGRNSLNNAVTLIASPQTDLVIGQLELTGNGEKCYFNLDQIKLKININDPNIIISGLRMYNDVNGNGIVDEGDILLSSADELLSGYAVFLASNPENRLWSDRKNNIIFSLNARYKEDSPISNSAFFTPAIERDDGILMSDDGKPSVEGLPIDFSKFQFEPDKGFIVTKGMHDPEVPARSEINTFRDILQIRVKANGANETIKKMTVKVPKNTFVNFGEGIMKLAVYEDSDNDGRGDKVLASATEFKNMREHQFTLKFDVPENTEKYLTIKAGLALSDGDTAQIQISGIVVNELDVFGLPVDSRPYEYICKPDLEECGTNDDGGCSVVTAEDNGDTTLFALAAAAMLLLSALAFRMKKN